MDCVNKPDSMVDHYRIKMCPAFMTSCLQAGATFKKNPATVYFGLLQAGHLH